MAIILPRTQQYELPLFHFGLVETDDRLYEEILSLTREKLHLVLKTITIGKINKAIDSVKKRHNLNSVELIMKNNRAVHLQLFINEIVTDENMSYADISLEFPWCGKTEHHTWVIEEILRLIPVEKEVRVEYGVIHYKINLNGKVLPLEVGKNGNNLTKFVAIEKSPIAA